MPSLTQIYNTEATRGSWDVISKFSIVGLITQFFLSALGLMSNISAILRTTATIGYLSNRRFFDEVDEAKTGGSSTFKEAKGFDKIGAFFKYIIPNIKGWSDYGSSQFYIDDDDTCLTYIVKSAPSTIGIIFFSTLAFNGILFQIYGNITDGMVAVASQARDLKIARAVNAWFSEGKDYNVTIDKAGTKLSKMQGKLAKAVYMDIIERTGTTSRNDKQIWGSQVETFMCNNNIKNKIDEKAKAMPDVMRYVNEQKKLHKGDSTVESEAMYKAIDVKIVPSAYKKGNTAPTNIVDLDKSNKSGSFFVPVNQIFNGAVNADPGFTGYIITVYDKVPASNTFRIINKAS